MVHRRGFAFQDWPNLVAVDPLSDRRATAVADQASNLLDRHLGVGEQRTEAVPQLTGRPLACRESCHGRDPTEPTANVGGIEHGPGVRGEHQAITVPPALSLQVLSQSNHATMR